jgi:hypothetical protein
MWQNYAVFIIKYFESCNANSKSSMFLRQSNISSESETNSVSLVHIEILSYWDVRNSLLLTYSDWYKAFFPFNKRYKYLSAIHTSNLEYIRQSKTGYSELPASYMPYNRFLLTLQLDCISRNTSNYIPTICIENVFFICTCLQIRMKLSVQNDVITEIVLGIFRSCKL